MATRRYSLNVGETEFMVTEVVGLATVVENIELTVDVGNVVSGNTRPPTKEEVLDALDYFRNHILKNNWPPA